jgi:hypothetical protein
MVQVSRRMQDTPDAQQLIRKMSAVSSRLLFAAGDSRRHREQATLRSRGATAPGVEAVTCSAGWQLNTSRSTEVADLLVHEEIAAISGLTP